MTGAGNDVQDQGDSSEAVNVREIHKKGVAPMANKHEHGSYRAHGVKQPDATVAEKGTLA